ncbi:hypothetical protein PG993_007083 [Apiospora rasikravindrae]|uniref:MFS transporter n=1 Tax=Apiospora rasikravindrae TaxID=990691 RepID=A0ABR1SWI7_9PEZI
MSGPDVLRPMSSAPSVSDPTADASEDQPLLWPRPEGEIIRSSESRSSSHDDDVEKRLGRVLPLAFAAGLALAATSAATVLAYSRILCLGDLDQSRCEGRHQQYYFYVDSFDALRTIASSLGVLSVGVARIWAGSDPRLVLGVWLGLRALGVGVLLLGVLLDNIYIAVWGSIVDGLASTHVLHFALAAVYAQTRDPRRFSRLMGTSLALYLLGVSVNPTATSWLFPNLWLSFGAAFAILGLSHVYLRVAVFPSEAFSGARGDAVGARTATTIASKFLDPVYHLYAEPAVRLPALALLLHNCAQSCLFTAIVMHTWLDFDLTARLSNRLSTIATAAPATYLLLFFYGVPKLQQAWKRRARNARGEGQVADADADADTEAAASTPRFPPPSARDLVCAIVCMLAQLIAVPWFLVDSPGAMYGLVAVASVGFAAPSFLKSYAVSRVAAANKASSALGALALTESVGSLVTPFLLGGLWFWKTQIFILTPSLLGASVVCLGASYFVWRQ